MNIKLYFIICVLALTVYSVHSSDIDMPAEQGFHSADTSTTPTQNSIANTKPSQSVNNPVSTQTSFTLEQKPIPKHIHDKGYGVLEGIIYPVSQQYSGKLPVARENMHDSRTGIFLTQPPIGYVLYRSNNETQIFDRILIDSNLNDTLSDEKPIIIRDITKQTPVKLYFSETPVAFGLQLGSKGIKLYPKYWREGKITLKDKTYNAALFKSPSFLFGGALLEIW